ICDPPGEAEPSCLLWFPANPRHVQEHHPTPSLRACLGCSRSGKTGGKNKNKQPTPQPLQPLLLLLLQVPKSFAARQPVLPHRSSHERENCAHPAPPGSGHHLRPGLRAADQGTSSWHLPAPAPRARGPGGRPQPGLCRSDTRGAGAGGAVPAGPVSYTHLDVYKRQSDASRAKPSDNCIASVDVQLPAKAEVLRFLDAGGDRPPREALAVLYFGDQADPNVTEYVVGPLPVPTYHRDVTVQKYGGKVPYHRRPVTGVEYVAISALIQYELRKAPRFLAACCASDGTDLAVLTTAPRGFKSGDRSSWFVVFHAVAGSGYYVLPVGLEVLVEHGELDISLWYLSQVFYNGRYFSSTAKLEADFLAGLLDVIRVEKPQDATVMGSMRPRRPPGTPGPLQYEPQGPRYSVRDNRVTFQGWSIAFGMNPNTGPRLFDIRYRRERIIYELSLQEALALYGSNCPGGMSTRYLDGSFGIGRFAYELVRGVDCPYTATYVDRHYLAESDVPRTNQNSLCVFEHDAALPLRRHFSDMQSLYYGGLRKSVLVIRAVSTLINYDYVWDFMFHSNGAVEVRVHATGYISSSFFHGQGINYGNKVGPHTLGTMHLHHIHYKVDLDIDGQLNSLEAQDMSYEHLRAPWNNQKTIERPFLRRERLERENKAAFPLEDPLPRYLSFTGPKLNRWGHARSYRLQVVSFPGKHLPDSSPMERAVSWGR
uniref:Amine oxidase n=1 Tax=Cairina moschata TaxID=8855 RepID=A0A8C3GMD9_CAIMO